MVTFSNPDGVYHVDFKYLFGSFETEGNINEYTGSLPAKNGTEGIFADIYRYRLGLVTSAIEPDNPKSRKRIDNIIASWWFGCNAYACTDKEKITEKLFSPDEDGAAEAVKWLQECYDNA